jgi:hypothetical protein
MQQQQAMQFSDDTQNGNDLGIRKVLYFSFFVCS